MKKNALRVPLINSALILGILSLLLYINSTHPDTTILSSLGLLIMTALKAVQWILAILLALCFCLAFLFAIFFGAIALSSPAESSRMYAGFRRTLAAWFLPFKEQSNNWLQNLKKKEQPQSFEPIRQELSTHIEEIRSQLHTTREILSIKIEQLVVRIDDLEKLTAEMPNISQVDALTDEVKGAIKSLAGIQGAVDSMQTCVQQTGEQILGDLPQRVQAMEQQAKKIDIIPLEEDIACMQRDLAEVREKADKALLAAEDNTGSEPEPAVIQSTPVARESEDDEHRIFSYFDNPADKQKVVELVASTLKKDMSYKQVIDFVVKGLEPDKGKIISSHPSLSKDYIRQCRRKN
ncbi:MAG: hypothetical protein D3923_06545 [Candidatus Electrothrix sp. AR3]|nr:hypothetical protein [Candidatus Electrothrix sp. AR3]